MSDLDRAVVSGNYRGELFGGYVVRGRSDPGRIMVPLMNGAAIAPAETKFERFVSRLRGRGPPVTYSCYPCMLGFEYGLWNRIVSGDVAFDEMLRALICRKESPVDAARAALDFPGTSLENPRLVALASEDFGLPRFTFGSYGTGMGMEPRIISTTVGDNSAAYLSSESGGDLVAFGLDDAPPDRLAEFLYYTILGDSPGIGAAACLSRPLGLFSVDIYNAKG